MDKKREKEITIMVWMPVQIMEMLHFCHKLTIWNLWEVIEYKSTGLKRSQLTKSIYEKMNVLMEKQENIPTG